MDGSIGECEKCENTKGSFPPACSLVYNYLEISPKRQEEGFVVPNLLSLSKSSTNAAYKINLQVIGGKGGRPFWYSVWELKPKQRPFTKGSAYIYEAKLLRETTKEEREWAESIYNIVSLKPLEQEITAEDTGE